MICGHLVAICLVACDQLEDRSLPDFEKVTTPCCRVKTRLRNFLCVLGGLESDREIPI